LKFAINLIWRFQFQYDKLHRMYEVEFEHEVPSLWIITTDIRRNAFDMSANGDKKNS